VPFRTERRLEFGVGEVEQRAAAGGVAQNDRDLSVDRRAVLVSGRPFEGEDEALRRQDLKIDAELMIDAFARRRLQRSGPAAADLEVGCIADRGPGGLLEWF